MAYEDTVDHLNESEPDVTGLTFALASCLVHEVYEMLPFMLLDSLEAIDADRIAALVEYFSDYAEHLVVALLLEDAAALDDDHRRLSEIYPWTRSRRSNSTVLSFAVTGTYRTAPSPSSA